MDDFAVTVVEQIMGRIPNELQRPNYQRQRIKNKGLQTEAPFCSAAKSREEKGCYQYWDVDPADKRMQEAVLKELQGDCQKGKGESRCLEEDLRYLRLKAAADN